MLGKCRFARTVALAFLVMPELARAIDPIAPPTTAAELVQGVLDQESKIHDYPILRIRVTGKGELSDRALVEAQAARAKGLPGIEPRRETRTAGELIFDKTRLRARWDTDVRSTVQSWDGKVAKTVTREQTPPRDSAGFAANIDNGVQVIGCLDWLLLGTHKFWWSPQGKDDEPRMRPDEFVLVGTESYAGRECFRLERAAKLRRLFIGKTDRRLYGVVDFEVPTADEELALVGRVAGAPFASLEEAADWRAKLTAAEQCRFADTLARQRFALPLAYSEFRFDDYHEVAPGFWLPWRWGVRNFGRDESGAYLWHSGAILVAAAEVNPSVSAETFDIDIPDGATVWDTRHEPPLSYAYKGKFSDAEWQAIVAENNDQVIASQKQRQAQQARLGQAAPALSGTWLNSSPRSWPEFRGKVVLLEFWDVSCGACRGDVPRLNALHRERDRSGIFVIGVHTAGSESSDIKKCVEEWGIDYPVYIDADDANQDSEGLLFHWFALDRIPFAALVNSDGKIAALGDVDELIAQARALAAAAK